MRPRTSAWPTRAFTLLEVMIAMGIFFVCIFAILALVSGTLRNARGLQKGEVDAGMVAAQFFKTNQVTEGTDSGDFGRLYPDYTWETDTYEADTNGLYQVDIVVRKRGMSKIFDSLSVWVYSPQTKSLPFGGRR